jgi:osmoprotectant transport system permease protein
MRFGTRRQYQPNLMYSALVSGDVDVITAFSSDGRIAQYGLTVLTDPKGALPPYDAILLVSPAHANDRAFLDALKPLIGAIDLKTMQQANFMVDRTDDKKSPLEAARWLQQRLAH